MIRDLIFYKKYFLDFYENQSDKIKEKIDYVLNLVCNTERVPEKFFKHLKSTNGIYEIRVKFGSDIFRILCFFDEGKLVVVLQGFQKKTEKTPKNEIEKAEKLKQKYFKDKKDKNL
jgi:phage-related protein